MTFHSPLCRRRGFGNDESGEALDAPPPAPEANLSANAPTLSLGRLFRERSAEPGVDWQTSARLGWH